jgi:putative ABC transport system permease protein
VLLQDLRYALRSLWFSKGFATVAILCLAFGIGLNTTIFSIMDGVLLQPYPYPDPDRILVVGEQNQKTDSQSALSYLDMRDINQSPSSPFVAIAASSGRSLTVSDGAGDPERYPGAAISWDLFSMLGTPPILGQGFTADQDRVGAGGVVLLSHDLWTVRYQQDPNIVGRTILINARPHQVVGVMPPGFRFPNQQRLWIPLVPAVANEPRDFRGLFAFGRLKPGVSQAQATQQLDAIFAGFAEQYPATHQNWTSRLRTLREAFLPPEVPTVIWIMMGSVTLVLLIACSNVASLLVARATSRRREISVRAALGAGRGRIVRQLLTESVTLSLLSLPLGVALAEIGTRLISAGMPTDAVPYYVRWTVDWRTVAYSAAIAMATALIFGLFPALQASRGDLHADLKEGTRGNTATSSLLRSSLVIVQVALALVSLLGALLFLRTFQNLDSANLGFDPRPLMTMRFFLPGEEYERPDAKLRRVEDIVRRVEALPGVQAAFASNYVPLNFGGGGGQVIVEGQPARQDELAGIVLNAVTPRFVTTMGMTLVGGRDFTDAEGWSRSGFAVINQMMARRFWPKGDAIGARFRLAGDATQNPWFTVIGIVNDVNLYGIDPENPTPPAAGFISYAYQQALNTGLTIRVAGQPASITSAARREIRASDPNLPVSQVQTGEEIRRLRFWQYGLYGWIFGTIGVAGLLLASVGVYGVLSYSVTQRAKEIGVRVALGAGHRDVLRLVVGQGVALCGLGVTIGLVLAPGATWFSRAMLYNVSPFDPLSFIAVAAMLMLVAFLASYLPARRATRVNPVTALRGE